MRLSDKFVEQDFFPKLHRRAYTFLKMVEHVENFQHPVGKDAPIGMKKMIVETGCTRIKDNWGGDGQSSRIWQWVVEQDKEKLAAVSVDITPEHIAIARELCPDVLFVESDSLKYFSNLSNRYDLWQCCLLYLDSFDWSKEINMDSAFHHVCELAMAYPHLPSGCMIVVDDRHSAQAGKHWLVQAFFEKLGIEPCFIDYQIGWIKP